MLKEEEFEGAVAMLDVLGFGSRTDNVGLEVARDTVVGPLLKATMDAQVIVMGDLQRFPAMPTLHYLYFADTTIVYLPCQPRSILSNAAHVLDSMVYACALLMASSIWMNVPLRGAIAYGKCLVCPDPLYLIGKPFLEAHELERAQNWAGVTLCESAVSNLEENPRVVEWAVPLKDGRETRLVVNWPRQSLGPYIKHIDSSGNEKPGPTPDWDACFCSQDESVQIKRRNTIEFFVSENPKGPLGVALGPEQRNLVMHWKQMYAKGKLSLD